MSNSTDVTTPPGRGRYRSPNGGFVLDDRAFPLVEVTQFDGHDESDWIWVLAQYERLFAQQERYVLLVDASGLTQTVPPKTRKIVGDWIRANLSRCITWNVGASVLMQSGLIRGAFTALMWLARPPVPLEFPATYAAGLAWCIARLERESIYVPLSLRKRQLESVHAPRGRGPC
jgi:hypothetical protein